MMDEPEFKKKMKELGWKEEIIQEIINIRKDAIKNNKPYLPYESLLLIKLPTIHSVP